MLRLNTLDYIIGVDGGGTKTEAVAYDLEDEVLASSISGFGNIILQFDHAMDNIIKAIDQCMYKLDSERRNCQCVFIFLGLAGIASAHNINLVEEKLFNKYKIPVKVTTDAHIAHGALLKGEDGILTISGTGSISYGVCGGNIERTGGWGHLLGDEGSGYYIAIEAFKSIVYEEDHKLPKSKFTEAILDRLGVKEPNDIKTFIYSSSKGDIASLVPVIVEKANQGDEKAINILKDAGKALALNTILLCRNLSMESQVKVGIKGSILTKINFVREEFQKELEEKLEGVTIIDDNVSPTKGAYYLAKKLIEDKDSSYGGKIK